MEGGPPRGARMWGEDPTERLSHPGAPLPHPHWECRVEEGRHPWVGGRVQGWSDSFQTSVAQGVGLVGILRQSAEREGGAGV